MALHAEPVAWTLRLYASGKPVAELHGVRAPFDAVLSVVLMGDSAWLYGLHGRFDRSMWREVEAWLRAQGVREARMERGGQVRRVGG